MFISMNKYTKYSYGIVCARYNITTQKVEILLVQRRCTYAYAEFLTKAYADDSRLMSLLNNMTHDEKTDILTFDFGRMWSRIWFINPESPYTPEDQRLTKDQYDNYLYYKNGFLKTYADSKKLKYFISKSIDTGMLWEVPKGRKNNGTEKDIVCAIREFSEETGIQPEEYTLLDDSPIMHTAESTKVKYVSQYHLALYKQPYRGRDCNKFNFLKLDYDNIHQIAEVSGAAWMDLDKIKSIDTGNKLTQVAKIVNKVLRKKYKIVKLVNIFLDQADGDLTIDY